MNFKKEKIVAFLVFTIAILITFHWILPFGLGGLMDRQLVMSGDGLKNYYTFAYSIKYNVSWWFDGYLYPFGDVGLYTDNQPLISWVLAQLSSIGLFDARYSLLFLTGSGIASLIAAAHILFLIMRHYGVDYFYAVVMALFAALMSPQIFKMAGHFGLSYSFVIPLYWWLLIQIESRATIIKYGLLTLFTWSLGYVHPYMMLSLILFAVSYFTAKALVIRELDFKVLLTAVIPLVLFLMIGSITDPVAGDRPENPNGVWDLKTEVSDLMPFTGVISQIFSSVPGVRTDHSEGYTYPGVLIFVFVLMIPFAVWRRFYLKDKTSYFLSMSPSLRVYLYSSFFILAFAMGIHGLVTAYHINDWIPPLGQFRCLGRFSWGFYYIAVVVFSFWMQRFIQSLESKYWRHGLFGLVVLVYTMDTISLLQSTNALIQRYGSNDLLHEDRTIADIVESAGRKSIDYQGVITLPVSTEGAEKLSFHDDFFTKIAALPYSYQTGLPLSSCIQSRAPVSRVMQVLQYGNSSYGDHSLRDHIVSDLPFLVVLPIRFKELFQDMYQRSSLLGQTQELYLLEISVDSLFGQDYFSDLLDTSFISLDTMSRHVYLESFEGDTTDNIADTGLYSSASFRSKAAGDLIVEWPLEIDSLVHFELSLWQYVGADIGQIPVYTLTTYNEDHKVKYETSFRELDFKRVEVAGDWIRYKQYIPMDSTDHFFSLSTSQPGVTVDWVLLKPREVNVFKNTENKEIMYSNHLFMPLAEH